METFVPRIVYIYIYIVIVAMSTSVSERQFAITTGSRKTKQKKKNTNHYRPFNGSFSSLDKWTIWRDKLADAIGLDGRRTTDLVFGNRANVFFKTNFLHHAHTRSYLHAYMLICACTYTYYVLYIYIFIKIPQN